MFWLSNDSDETRQVEFIKVGFDADSAPVFCPLTVDTDFLVGHALSPHEVMHTGIGSCVYSENTTTEGRVDFHIMVGFRDSGGVRSLSIDVPVLFPLCGIDLTGDGLIDLLDFRTFSDILVASVQQNGYQGLCTCQSPLAHCTPGDLNGDERVDLADFAVFQRELTAPPDCNHNGIDDRVDCRNGAPDCNHNLIPDSCDIAIGSSYDCDLDGVPDECAIMEGRGNDCNENGQLDSCDIRAGKSLDCNNSGIPDECEIRYISCDCDANGIPDECSAK